MTYTGIIQSSDGLAMFATAESIARRGEADMNQLLWMGNQQGNIGPDGNLYSRKGLGMTLLAVPLVWAARLSDRVGLVHAALLLNPLLTAAAGALLYRAGIRLRWSRPAAVLVAVTFGLATLAWPYTQTFFSDPVCAFGLFAAYYGLLSFAQNGRKLVLAGAGLAWGLAYLTRSVNLLTLPIYLIGLWAVVLARARLDLAARRRRGTPPTWRDVPREQWRPIVSFLIPVVAAGLLSLWWNWARFGSVWDSGYVASESFSAPWLAGLYGLVLGPARGLFWYSPILLLAPFGVRWFRRHERQTLGLAAAVIVLYVVVYAKWYMWHGGYSWGPRFLVPTLPFLALLTGPVWEGLLRRRGIAWLAALLLFALSVAVQWLGMLVPFGLVQEYLAETVQPLFAPETFTQVRYSPLLLQWRFLSPENVILAWWRGGEADWLALGVLLAAVAVALALLVRRVRREAGDAPTPAQRYAAYGAALVVLTLALLVYAYRAASATESHLMATRVAAGEQRGDATLHLLPSDTQAYSNSYRGRQPVYGLAADAPPETVSEWLTRLSTPTSVEGYRRLWVVPDYAPPENSAWELPLRTGQFLVQESRPAGQEGRRLALYALAGAGALAETGLGTIFADPALAGQTITDATGWFRLAGYGLTRTAQPGREILLALRWESLQAVDYDYHVFVHLLNGQGERVAQRDGQPVQWLRPTSTWQPGEEIVDRYGIPLPPELPVGQYTIAIGLYDPVSGQRLPVNAGPGDYTVEVGPIQVAHEAR